MSEHILHALRQQFGAEILETHSAFGDDTALVEANRWREVAEFVRDDPDIQMNMFIDLTVVDYLGQEGGRFEVVCHLRSQVHAHRIRLKARVGDGQGHNARIASLTPVWTGANWFEREAFDMFGVHFIDHPDLRRILLYPEFEGYPLRKDYEASDVQPLVPYRDDAPTKLPPFGSDEGMPFGRQIHMGVEAGVGRAAAANPPDPIQLPEPPSAEKSDEQSPEQGAEGDDGESDQASPAAADDQSDERILPDGTA